jgi:ATP-dependent DNA ligase
LTALLGLFAALPTVTVGTAVASRLKASSLLINGKAVICREDGLSDFHALRSRRRDHEAMLFAFEL